MKAEGKNDNVEYKALCRNIKINIKENCEGYSQKKLREAVIKKAGVKKAEIDVSLKQYLLMAFKDVTDICTTD